MAQETETRAVQCLCCLGAGQVISDEGLVPSPPNQGHQTDATHWEQRVDHRRHLPLVYQKTALGSRTY